MNLPDATFRAFIALSIPAQVKAWLEKVVIQLAVQVRGEVSWVGMDDMHLTLRFPGNVDPGHVENITGAMRTVALGASPFKLRLSGLYAFPNENMPRVIWVAVQGDLQLAEKLHARMEANMWGLGFQREKRPLLLI